MYRCETCGAVRGPRLIRLTHVVLRPCQYGYGLNTSDGMEIEREIKVCSQCKQALETGATLADLARRRYAAERKARLPVEPLKPQECGPVALSPEALI
jgi:hypothetical protein